MEQNTDFFSLKTLFHDDELVRLRSREAQKRAYLLSIKVSRLLEDNDETIARSQAAFGRSEQLGQQCLD